jgi:hypothetical protein
VVAAVDTDDIYMPTPIPDFTQFGSGDYVFGIDNANTDIVDGMAVETISITASPEFEAFAKNTAGATAAYVKGRDKFEFTASGFLTNEAAFDGNNDFTYQGHFFIINRREKSNSNVDFRKCSIGGVAYPLITAVAP